MDKYQLLIKKIEQTNLSDKDKKLLIGILKEDDIDLNKFAKTFLTVLKIGKELLKLLDFEIGDG